MKKPLPLAAVTLLVFLTAALAPRYVGPLLGFTPKLLSPVAYSLYMAAWWVGLPMLALGALYGRRRILPELGWAAPMSQGLLMGLGCTLPMLLGYLALFPLTALSGAALAGGLLRGAVWAGLGEETLFRGFLFGQLYRRVGWPWLLTVLVESGIFATGHLYQSHDLLSAVGVLAVTFGGGVWFGWLYKSWRNLWVPIGLHICMNGWWMLFDVSDTALGNGWANVFRVLTIGLSVAATLWYRRRPAAPAPVTWQPAVAG